MKLLPGSLDGVNFYIEADEQAGVEELGAQDRVVADATAALRDAEDLVAKVGEAFASRLQAVAEGLRPSRVEIGLTLRITAGGSVIVATTEAEAGLTVSLVYDLK